VDRAVAHRGRRCGWRATVRGTDAALRASAPPLSQRATLRECLREFDAARALAYQPAAVEMAIWFHDAIYDPRAADNEERSAELARLYLAEARVSVAFQDSVARLVLATKQHDGSLDPDAPLMVDIDLSIFGQPAERFWQYEEQIRGEYEWVARHTGSWLPGNTRWTQ